MSKLYHVTDGSYTLKLKDSELVSVTGNELRGTLPSWHFMPPNRTFEIIAEGCDLPGFIYPGMLDHVVRNNTIIKATDNGDIVFIRRNFLKEVPTVIPTIDNECYKRCTHWERLACAEIEKLQKETEELKETNKETSTKVKNIKRKLKRLEDYIDDLESENAELRSSLTRKQFKKHWRGF